jgi:antitoxin component HigA of HigAB toxin-antitoxin module
MPSKTLAYVRRDDYLSLVQVFPLKKVRSEAEHAEALRISGHLIGLDRRLSAGESQYLDALVVLLREYEATHHDPKLPKTTGIDLLKHLMAEHGMTQRQLAGLLDIGESAASMILSGMRDLTKSHISALSRHFGIGVGAFFE